MERNWNETEPLNMAKQNTEQDTEQKEENFYISQEQRRKEEEEKNQMIMNYPFFGLASLIYALFYTFCLYQNKAGITFPLFTAGTLYFFYLCFKKLGVKMKKDNIFCMVAIELFGISTFATGDERIIAMNKLAIFILLIVFVLHTVYDDRRWNFLSYIKAMIESVFLTLEYIDRPIKNAMIYTKRRAEKRKEAGDMANGQMKWLTGNIKYILLGILSCIPIVILVLGLLLGADAVFEEYFEKILTNRFWSNLSEEGFKAFLLTVFIFFLSFMVICFLNQKHFKEEEEKKNGEPVIAITIASVLSLIYLIFSGIQIIFLFIGGITGNLTLPNKMTYCEYARQGFFQLLFVCLINLVIVLAGMYLFRDHKLLKFFMSLITICTYIMILSSAWRMLLYIQYQYLTFLRIFVLWALFVIALVMAGVFINIWKNGFPLFRYIMFTVTLCYLVFSYSRPDYFIAKVNTDNINENTQYEFFKDSPLYDDYHFLANELGTDAAPVILRLVAPTYLQYHYDEGTFYHWSIQYRKNMEKKIGDMRIRNFNLSYFIALREMKNESLID